MISSIKSVIQIVHKLTSILTSGQKKNTIGVFIVIIVSAAFELLGVTAILPFMQILVTPEEIMQNSKAKPIITFFGVQSTQEMLILIGVGLILIYILKNAYMIFSYYVQYSYSAGVQRELSVQMLQSYMARPYTFFINVNSGEVLRGCSSDINSVYMILSNIFTILSELLATLVIGIFIFYTEPIIAISILSLMALVGGAIVLGFKPRMKRLGKRNMEALAKKNKAIYQTVTGVKELFVMQRKELFIEDYANASKEAARIQKNYDFMNASPERIIEGACVSGLIGIIVIRLLLGVEMLSFIPKLGAFAMAAFKILPSIGKISNRVTGLVYHMPMLDNVCRNVREAKEYDKIQQEYEHVHREISGSVKQKFQNKLLVKNVTWKYKEQTKAVLQDVSLEIQKGESVAFIGPSGAGKTTLSDVILGLLQPQQGGIYMDGVDVYAMPMTWAKIIGYVPQSVFLIDDTVRNNVAFGLKNIDDTEIWDSLERAQLRVFVEQLPDGLDTIVGERGVKFSGGQRQRIAIARALFNKPQILVLDEATASLDSDTETAVMEAIDSLQGQITMIIVAHRLSTIRNCDRIYQISKGKAILKDRAEVFEDNSYK